MRTNDVAATFAKQLIKLLKKGGIRLTKFFFSNSNKVLEALPKAELSSSAILEIEVDRGKQERALGVSWDAIQDMFTFVAISSESAVKRYRLSSIP